MKVRDGIKPIENDGWYQVAQKGSLGNSNTRRRWVE
jgi:predicted RNA binding protein YcfA (HicA-like mRNA interferase family)